MLFEAPARVAATLADLRDACGPDRSVALARELTKLHEEVWRGRLGDAVDRVAAVEPRGEHVIVVAPAAAREPAPVDDEALGAALDVARSRGLSARDAAAAVAAQLGVPKRRAYDAAARRRRS